MAAKTEEKKPRGIVDLLAALMYFDGIKPEKRKESMSFEKLTEAEAAPFLKQAGRFLEALDKLGLAALPKVDPKAVETKRAQDADALTAQIEAFVKTLTTTKPGLFPCRELALRILAPKA